jgi:hypothetical protein
MDRFQNDGVWERGRLAASAMSGRIFLLEFHVERPFMP